MHVPGNRVAGIKLLWLCISHLRTPCLDRVSTLEPACSFDLPIISITSITLFSMHLLHVHVVFVATC